MIIFKSTKVQTYPHPTPVIYNKIYLMYTLTLDCEPYLRQWYIDHTGSEEPVKIPRKSPEASLLLFGLKPKSQSYPIKTSSSALTIQIPTFKGLNPDSYIFLPEKSRKAFISILRAKFDLQLFRDIIKPGLFAANQDEITTAWMEAHGIEINDTNFQTIIKKLKRMKKKTDTSARVARFRQAHRHLPK